ncbi:MAG: mitochondrial fission ELM1 family protein [Pseudomonadota bacterium]
MKSNNVAVLRNEWKETVAKATEIWVLTDGRAGNLTQALGLAEAIARLKPSQVSVKNAPLKPWAALVPPSISHFVPASQRGWPFLGMAEEADPLNWPWPDLIVSAGRRIAPISAALKKLHGIPVVHLLDPQMTPAAFDAVIVPQHDDLQGASVLHSLGALNRQTRETVAAAGKAWRCPKQDLPIPQLAVLIGGPSKSARFTEADGKTLLLALDTLAKNFGLLITTSRRTSPELIGELRAKLSDRAFVWSGADDGPNPYPGLLSPAVAILVTEDSVNMASEAASTGKPVHVFPITSLAAKLVRFHEALEAHGASQRYRGEIRHWQYEPLAEADRIAADLMRRGIL